MATYPTPLFTVRWSVVRYLKESVAALDPTLPVIVNRRLTPGEEAFVAASPRHLLVNVTTGAIAPLTPVEVTCSLCAAPSADPSGAWLDAFASALTAYCRTYHSDAANHLIAMYDFDAVCGASARATFLQTGQLPNDFDAIVSRTSAALPPYEVAGQRIGLQWERSTAPKLDLHTQPWRCTWGMTLRYYHLATLHTA